MMGKKLEKKKKIGVNFFGGGWKGVSQRDPNHTTQL